MGDDSGKQNKAILGWYDRLADRDPELFAALKESAGAPTYLDGPVLEEGIMREGVGMPPAPPIALETIVQKGRPALFVLNGKISPETPLTDPASRLMIERVMAAADKLDPLMPLIGRIDVVNHPAGYPYVGTGWLIRPGIVCTNRHVANLIGKLDGARYIFSRGRFDRALEVSLNHRHERDSTPAAGDAVIVREILWIEPEPGPDVALLRIDLPADGTRPSHLELADSDGAPDQFITTIGYPARAYEDTIPDQQWMDEIYGGIYDVKRAAPGQLDQPALSSTTYDATTLGGASGSPVIDMRNGQVLALHYAGLFKVENYGVPASVLRRMLAQRPWLSLTPSRSSETPPPSAVPPPTSMTPPLPAVTIAPRERSVSVTIPVTISVSIGDLPAAPMLSLDQAIRQLAAERREGVLAVKRGYRTLGAADQCIVVAADPRAYDAVQAAMPASYGGFQVEIRYATIDEQLGLDNVVSEAAAAIVYDDTRRTGPEFSFNAIEEEMTVTAHVGPEQSFPVLKAFVGKAQKKLVSSMYQFFVSHIADAVEDRLKNGVTMTAVLDPLTRDRARGGVKPGEFDRSETFERWRQDHEFRNIYVPEHGGGLVETSYHIKVTVRDGNAFWLSSGNWTRASQPLPDAQTGSASGNREWHAVVENKRLATMFEAHIKADFDQCAELGARAEAPAQAPIMVDVPVELTSQLLTEAPVRTLQPKVVSGKIKVKPILTPDHRGRIYTDAVLELIRSARRQLVFQNQYIKILEDTAGNLGELVDALVAQSKVLEDFRIILRSGDLFVHLTELKRRGMDVARHVRIRSDTHTKGIVVDGKRVLLGSQNWSVPALSTNRDASLLFDNSDLAAYFLEAFEIDWARGGTPSLVKPAKAAVLAEGPTPPPGYVRMTLDEYNEG